MIYNGFTFSLHFLRSLGLEVDELMSVDGSWGQHGGIFFMRHLELRPLGPLGSEPPACLPARGPEKKKSQKEVSKKLFEAAILSPTWMSLGCPLDVPHTSSYLVTWCSVPAPLASVSESAQQVLVLGRQWHLHPCQDQAISSI